MKCSICKYEIEKQYDPDGKMYWDSGHNAQPINDGRCCNTCNGIVVIPMRLLPHFAPDKTKLEMEKSLQSFIDYAVARREEE
jgi:hypothetical protein